MLHRSAIVMKTDVIVAAHVTNGTTTKVILNLPKILSSYNRRGMNNVDASGNAQLYTVSASLIGANANAICVAAPNTYATKRAVKDWHKAWVRRLRKAGIKRDDLGSYMKFLRPYLDRAHYSSATSTSISGVTAVTELDEEVITWDGSSGVKEALLQRWTGEEWSHTEVVYTNPYEGGDGTAVTAGNAVGEHALTLCDVDVESYDGRVRDLTTAGMIYSWLGSFTQRPTPTEAETLIDPTNQEDNALMALRDSDASSGELLEMAHEAVQEKAPWDRDGDSYYQTQNTGGIMAARSGNSNTVIAEVPCGLLQLNIENDDNGTQLVYVNLEVVGIEDM